LLVRLPTPTRAVERSFRTTVKEVKDILVVREFLDVFPDNLPGLPPDRAVEFLIELKPNTAPISRRAYRMLQKNWQNLRFSYRNCLIKVMSDLVHHRGDVLQYLSKRRTTP
jgi:hypothetical protein